jgi:CDP-diacylglycerol--serine O-phosphatidyltransferase
MRMPDVFDVSYINLAPALLIPCFAAYRLAKFNLDTRQSENFIGMPTPAVGLLVASFPLILLHNPFNLAPWLQNIWVLYTVILLLCYLMVAEIPMLSLKFKNLQMGENWPRISLIVLAVVGAPLLKFAAVPVVFICYVLLSVIARPATGNTGK